MQNSTRWRTLLRVDKTIVEAVDLDVETGILIASVRPTSSVRNRCGSCRRRCPRYDAGDGRRRWRSLDAGSVQIQLEATAPRVSCQVHGVTVAAVPWARHQSGHTLFFDDQAADLTRIGIDEISYKRGHKYLTCVVDHDSGRHVWAAPGPDKATLATFFDALGPERSAQITYVSADGAAWIASVVAERATTAIRHMTLIAFGFKSPDALIALAMLSLGGHKPPAGFNPRKNQESPISKRYLQPLVRPKAFSVLVCRHSSARTLSHCPY